MSDFYEGTNFADSGEGHSTGAPAGETQPTSHGEDDALSRGRQHTLADVISEVTRIAGTLRGLTTGMVELRTHVNQGFRHMDERINRSRMAETDIRAELRLERTFSMPEMMPKDVKPAKVQNIASTNIDDLRNWYRHARGYLKYYNVDPEEPRSVFWASGFLEGPLSKWWHSRVALSGDEVGGGFPGISSMEQDIIKEFCGRTPAKQARINLDKARQKTTVQKYANYFREQLLELPHRTEEDNVHDFQRGLRQSIRKEVALKDPKTLTEAVQAALAVEAAERETEENRTDTSTARRLQLMASASDHDEESEGNQEHDDDGDESPKDQNLFLARRLTAEEMEKNSRRRANVLFAARKDTSPLPAQNGRPEILRKPGRESEN